MGGYGTMSKTRRGRKNFTTKKGDLVYHQNHHYVRKTHKPYSFRKNSTSKTRPGLLDFTTKLGSTVFNQNGKYIRKNRAPYTKRRRN
jgi:hypothetical protein